MKERDVVDKERVREKRREKRQKKREREIGEREDEDGDQTAVLAPQDDREDGYETPDFDLGDEEEEEDRFDHATTKRTRFAKSSGNLQEDEQMALRLLGGV
jgi:ATP-dependent RNA helicase DDX10/DBP4